MKPGFMSSVHPTQTLPELIETAQRYGYKGIEFRTEWGHKNGIELDATPAQLRAARQQLADGEHVAARSLNPDRERLYLPCRTRVQMS